jgi:virginiamycin B lyase
VSTSAGAPAGRPHPARRRLGLTALAVVLVAAAGAWRAGPWRHSGFVEYRMPSPMDIPAAVAVAPDGAVWFTIENSDSIGLFRDGQIVKFPKGKPNVEPIGLAVDAGGFAWYTDAAGRAIARIRRDGAITSFRLPTPADKLARLTVAADGAVWFADGTSLSVTRLKNGVFTRFETSSFRATPFGVAVDPGGAVWATLGNANRLERVSPEGRLSELDIPTRGSVPSDIRVDPTGAVWFLEFRANKIGRYAGQRFTEFPVPTPSAGLTGLAIAPDGAVWFAEIRGHALGRLRDGVITEFALPRSDARPFDVAVDAANDVWYTDLSGWLGRLSHERAQAR